MSCWFVPGAVICNSLQPNKLNCRELMLSDGRTCQRCPALECRYRKLDHKEVARRHKADWKREKGVAR